MRLRSWLVVEQAMTCESCPVQVEGRLLDGRHFYFRYRWGRATLGLGGTASAVGDDWYAHRDEFVEHGDNLQGVFESEEDLNAVFDELLAARA